jgi:transposase
MLDRQQVEVDEREEIVGRVAAIDVAKASGMVCTRVPHATKAGQRVTRVWRVPSTTNAILELAEQLAGEGIQRVVVESTSDYWRPFVRHEVPRIRAEVKGLRLRPVAAGR